MLSAQGFLDFYPKGWDLTMAKRPKRSNEQAEPRRTAEKYSVEHYKQKIMAFLLKSGKKPLSQKDLEAKCRSQRGRSRNFETALLEMTEQGRVVRMERGFCLTESLGGFRAKITRLQQTFGFAEREEDCASIFVPGKYLMGAMPGDLVLMQEIKSRSGDPEGRVLRVLVEADARITGVLGEEDGERFLVPDTMARCRIPLSKNGFCGGRAGDKVLAELSYRGKRHADHRVRILTVFGSCDNAANCAAAMLAVSGIPTEFPDAVLQEADKLEHAGVQAADFANRLDLRDQIIFTIDGAESKDLDDAISIERRDNGYRLGVHIADVSHYVKGNNALDKEALNRGTSVYYADQVIPMLPKALSNGICSLNPDEDRLAFSAIMDLDADGALCSYEFHKTVIRSRVKGIYSEINTIFDGTAAAEIMEKYKDVTPALMIMKELAEKRIQLRESRGVPEIETTESKILMNEDGLCVDVLPRTRGFSEQLIEEFMLLANESAARTAKHRAIPFVYRVHEAPSPEKIDNLEEVLTKMNVEHPVFRDVRPVHFATILREARKQNNPLLPVLNLTILRAMSKAKYAPEAIGHFGLALEDYAHFTSPIRRYSDLAIHRILTDVVAGYSPDWFETRYAAFVVNASAKATSTEIRAMKAENDCEACYKAEYMAAHIGEDFDGIISSVTDFGFYVTLENTVEGLVHIHSLPVGEYMYDGVMSLSERFGSKSFTLAQKVRVRCVRTDVNSGNIDFALVEEE